ncbi:3-dehydroquinate synthase [Mycobacterium marinum]|uniref:2-epi-5-epi-valiolone synthase n=1 Tax=Mycobacterium marinum TaxID=1781 RepID=A0A3E2N074_MYCMR|nr:3-dehydroquinate synthase [Mycobacterium marinum]RFZ45416.1 3-dehydroquinate synthase [Mycobacterium marinum]GJO50616.1 3-dehydroquinate synthase [Mycobacterium marinum]CDM74683.1 3-dehydroquinate synthase AroB_1 [Mycobacterium marinum E11]
MIKNASGQTAWTVEAVKQVRYHVIKSDGLFDLGNNQLFSACSDAPLKVGDRRLVIIDGTVDALHGSKVRAFFAHHGVEAEFVVIPIDETLKHWDTVTRIVDAMNAFGIDRRREPMLVIGGGVLTDVAGFAASLYRRGTPYIRIPTTLIGLVDAGVGVKTGVNYQLGKNRLGTYAPPTVTFLDKSFLCTLDQRHLSNGLAEILKIALIKSGALFDVLETSGRDVRDDHFQGSTSALEVATEYILDESIHLMLEELQPNLWESTLERCVDYGHTFSPTIEMHASPALLHGEAVNLDMAVTTAIGELRGYVSEDDANRIYRVMVDLGLPLWDDTLATPELLIEALIDTVRHRDGQQRLPLPVGIGHHRFVNDVTPEEIQCAVALLKQHHENLTGSVAASSGVAR